MRRQWGISITSRVASCDREFPLPHHNSRPLMRLVTLLLVLLAAIPAIAQPSLYIGRESTGVIDRVAEANLNTSGTRVAQGVAPPSDLAFDGTYLYAASVNGNEIARVDSRLGNNNVQNQWVIGATNGTISGITTDNTFLYWTDRANRTITRMPLDKSSAPTILATLPANASIYHITADQTHLYWADAGRDAIGRMRRDGTGTVEPSWVGGVDDPTGVTTEGSFVYWTNRIGGNSHIGRVDKDGTTSFDKTWIATNASYIPYALTATPTNLFVLLLPISSPTASAVQRFTLGGMLEGNSYVAGGTSTDNLRAIVATSSTDANLPVELIEFSATLDGGSARLDWATASETNNAGFYVEHRAPRAAGFADLDFVPGAGTTLEAQSYTLGTSVLAPGVHRFRLRQVDLDGARTFSPVVELAVGMDEAMHLTVSPNPATDATRVGVQVGRSQHIDVSVYDLLGRRVGSVFSGQMKTGEAMGWPLDTARLPSGVYSVVVTGETFRTTQAFTIAR